MNLPNLIYVFADQLRYASLGCHGDKRAQTPHLNAFAIPNLRCRRTICRKMIRMLMNGRGSPHESAANCRNGCGFTMR